MKIKHKIRFVLLIVLVVAAAILVIRGVAVAAASRQKLGRANKELTLGAHYLNDMEYEAAVAAFQTVLKIDDKSMTAYMGLALAYEGSGEKDMMIEVLEQGKNLAGGEIYGEMLRRVENGEKLGDTYSIVDTGEDDDGLMIRVEQNPFNTLNVLGSNYYEWDIISCAELFDFDYEQYSGQSVDLGWYQDFSVSFDGVSENPGICFKNDGYTYSYEYQENSRQQIFRMEGYGTQSQPSQLKEFGSSLKIGMTYQEIMNLTGLDQLEDFQENIYYIVDSNLGQLSGICWKEGEKTIVGLRLSSREGLGINFAFVDGVLKEITYVCSVPNNLRSKVIGWLGDKIL